ncbi:MAG: hypothetical protein ACNI25_10020 [Halarcobacter sp.]
MKFSKFIASLSVVTLLTTSVFAEAVTAAQAATIVKQNIAKLTAEELSQVQGLVGELKASGLDVVGAEAGTTVTATQAANISKIVTIMTNNPQVAAALEAQGVSVAAATAAISTGTLTAAAAAVLTAVAIGASGGSTTTHSHH